MDTILNVGLTEEIVETQTIDNPISTTYSFALPSHTDDGEEIPYKILYEINDENNDWTVDPIQKDIIYYKDKKQAVSKHVFDQYTAESTFYIDKVEITDLSGKIEKMRM